MFPYELLAFKNRRASKTKTAATCCFHALSGSSRKSRRTRLWAGVVLLGELREPKPPHQTASGLDQFHRQDLCTKLPRDERGYLYSSAAGQLASARPSAQVRHNKSKSLPRRPQFTYGDADGAARTSRHLRRPLSQERAHSDDNGGPDVSAGRTSADPAPPLIGFRGCV